MRSEKVVFCYEESKNIAYNDSSVLKIHGKNNVLITSNFSIKLSFINKVLGMILSGVSENNNDNIYGKNSNVGYIQI